MIIRAQDLDPEGLEIDLPLDVGPLRSETDETILVEGAVLRGRVTPGRRGLSFSGRLVCRAEVQCARCVTPFTMEIDRSFDLHYSFSQPRGKEIQIPEEELDEAFLQEGDGIDLHLIATEQIYLEIPMKPLCRSTCRGLCARCGADLNKGGCLCEALSSQA